MLSTVSPIKLSQSITCSGSSPVFARTCSALQTISDLSFGFSKPTCGETSWRKSLSALAMTTLISARAAQHAWLAIQSSASTPSLMKDGMFEASRYDSISGN
jgi:hypothetical protein